MGYSTGFTGHVTVEPPLNGPELDYLRRFADSRRYQCSQGPYHAATDRDPNRHEGCQAIATSTEPTGQPSLWCAWVPTPDGTGIEWSEQEKFHDGDEWMRFLIDTFLKSGAVLQIALAQESSHAAADGAFRHFTFNHVVSGRIEAQGDNPDDRWTLAVEDNVVTKVKYPTLAERMDGDAKLRAAFDTLREAGVTVSQFAKQTGQDY